MQKFNILYEKWYENTGLYICKVETKYGTFTVNVFCAEEDKDIQSSWAAIDLIAYKINMEILRRKSKTMRERYLGIKTAYNNLTQNHESEPRLERQMKIAKRDYEKIKQQYLNMKNNYSQYAEEKCKQRREFKERYPEKE